jgi:DNA-binding NarL/FixJ family response regulator
VCLVDLRLPDRDGADVGAAIKEASPRSRVVALTAMAGRRAMRDTTAAGFDGYLTKDTPVQQLAEAIRQVHDGNALAAGSPAGVAPRTRSAVGLVASQLTDREREVLELLVEGLDGREIGRRLSISLNTVRTHVQSILTKLQVHSRLEAAAFAVRHAIVARPAKSDPSGRRR